MCGDEWLFDRWFSVRVVLSVSDDMIVPAAYRQKDVFYFAYVPVFRCVC